MSKRMIATILTMSLLMAGCKQDTAKEPSSANERASSSESTTENSAQTESTTDPAAKQSPFGDQVFSKEEVEQKMNDG